MKNVMKLIVILSLMTLYTIVNSNTVLAESELPSIGHIDAPNVNSVLKGEVTVSGWFLDGNGVSKVEVLIDGKSMGLANYGQPRVDVGNAYSAYQNNNAGYQYNLNTRSLSNGKHTLTIRGTSSNGQVTDLENRVVTVENPLAKGQVDAPTNGAIIKGDTSVRGWILDYSGIQKAEVLVDGKTVGTASYGGNRPDVASVYPEYGVSNSGFDFKLSTKNLTNGKHSVTVKGIGNNGTTSLLNAVEIQVQNPTPIASIDYPSIGAKVSGELPIRGWLLDYSEVSKIEILVDGKSMGTASYGAHRPDVANAYPEYQSINSGFEYLLNTKYLTNGQHAISIKETGKNGTVTLLGNQIIQVDNPAPIGQIDTPTNGALIEGKAVPIRGWFLDYSDIEKIEVLVDGKVIGKASYGGNRPDVANVYPQYKNTNSGFEYILDSRLLTNGQHSLTIKGTGKNGSSTVLNEYNVTVKHPETIGQFDTPGNNAVVQGDIPVRGWALDYSGVANIEVLVDGKSIGKANYGGGYRPDVANVYPIYDTVNSGFETTLNTRQFTNGVHTISIKETGKNGAVKILENRQINIQNPEPIGSIDTPTVESTLKDTIAVRGWFIDGSGVSKIEIFVDGNLMGRASYGGYRPDVAAAYPQYNNTNSGYEFMLNTDNLSNDKHTLTVKETGINGSTKSINIPIYVENGTPYRKLDLRKPANITAQDIVNFFNRKGYPNSPLKQNAQGFIDAQYKYGVNAQYLVAHAIWETGWDGSNLRNYKNNYFGYGAYDSCPFTCGYYFPSGAASVEYEAYIVRKDYLNPTGSYFNGSTLAGMNIKYATDQNWSFGIASVMESMKSYDEAYYSKTAALSGSIIPAPSYGRDIPIGSPIPTNVIINDPKEATITTDNLALRSIPYQMSSSLIGTLSKGTKVQVLGYNTDVRYGSSYPYDERWYRVNVNGKQGFVYGGGIKFE